MFNLSNEMLEMVMGISKIISNNSSKLLIVAFIVMVVSGSKIYFDREKLETKEIN